jgi:ring-1,2-phenylacetyl-CoA epoxidase subunit PaaE
LTPKFHQLKISQVRQECADAISICFDIPKEHASDFSYQPGQHLTLKANVGGQELRRSYSICSGLDDGEIRIAVKKVPGGVFSTWANESLKAGAQIDVMTPEGKFGVPISTKNKKHYVGFAAGSGITPVLSMVKTILVREPQSTFTLIYGNRRQSTAMFQEDLEDLKNRYLTRFSLFNTYSGEVQDAPIFNGRLDGQKVSELLKQLVPVSSIDEAFICGPGAMIDEVEKALLEGGLEAKRIHLERFGVPVTGAPAHFVAKGDAAQATITVIQDGLKREVDFHEGDPSILDAALAQGMDLPYSCKGGVCNTCRCKVLEGEVRMDRNFALEPEEVEQGFVLSCQAHPITEKVVISFDDR